MKNSNIRTPRQRYPMPPFILKALTLAKLYEVYLARPAYQQNDYIGWITRAKREVTTSKRLHQMLNELKSGGVYMKMKYNSK